MDRLKTVRNIAIVALIAAAVEFLPGGGRAAEAFAAIFSGDVQESELADFLLALANRRPTVAEIT